jgi:hypothetical protein
MPFLCPPAFALQKKSALLFIFEHFQLFKPFVFRFLVLDVLPDGLFVPTNR